MFGPILVLGTALAVDALEVDPGVSTGAVLIAGIVALSTVSTPILTAWLAGKQKASDQKADWDRQDIVAERLLRANEKVDGKLDVIHGLVNSQMTAALQAELDAVSREKIALEEIIDLKRAQAGEPTAGALAAIKAATDRIEQLQKTVQKRHEEDRLAKEEAEAVTKLSDRLTPETTS